MTTSRQVYSNSKEVPHLLWQNKYSNWKTFCLLKPNYFFAQCLASIRKTLSDNDVSRYENFLQVDAINCVVCLIRPMYPMYGIYKSLFSFLIFLWKQWFSFFLNQKQHTLNYSNTFHHYQQWEHWKEAVLLKMLKVFFGGI